MGALKNLKLNTPITNATVYFVPPLFVNYYSMRQNPGLFVVRVQLIIVY